MGGRLQREGIYVYIQLHVHRNTCMGFPGGADGEESACSAGDPGLVPVSGRSLEKAMATHSSVLAWRIPWIEEPGGLQSRGVSKS